MSANAWRTCPRCARTRGENLRRMYGKVPEEEYRKLVQKEADEDDGRDWFREDYEICTTREGKFVVSYHGACEKCGFTHRFNHEQQLDTTPGDGK